MNYETQERDAGKEVIAGERDHVIGLAEHANAAGEDLVDEPEDSRVCELAREGGAENGVIDRLASSSRSRRSKAASRRRWVTVWR